MHDARPVADVGESPRASLVRVLLERAVRAGQLPCASAAWQLGVGQLGVGQLGVGQLGGGPEPEQVHLGPVSVRTGRPARGAGAPIAAVGPSTWFDLASLTKPLVTTTLMLQAAREGRVCLDGRLEDHLPEARNTAIGRASLLQLLSHTAGLPAWLPLYALARPSTALSCLCAIEPASPPGERVEYSCLGFILLGILLERALDTPLEEAFVARALRPLGLEAELGFRPGRLACTDLAEGAIEPDAERLMVREKGLDPDLVPRMELGMPDDGNARFLGGVAGNAGLFGTARGTLALARHLLGWLLADYSGEEQAGILTVAEMKLATLPHSPQGDPAHRGLGWQLAPSVGCSAGPGLSAASFGHTGFTGASLWIDPFRGLVAVLLANRNHPTHRGVNLHPLRRRFHSILTQTSPALPDAI